MLNIKHLLLAVAFLGHGLLAVDTDLSHRDAVYDFIQENLIGHSLDTELITIIAGGKIETEFNRSRQFANLVKTDKGLKYDALVVIEQKNFDLDEEGKRIDKDPIIKNRTLVVRYELSTRTSTGEVVGFSRILSNSISDPTGKIESVRATITGEKLVLKTKTVLYADHYSEGDTKKPGIADITIEYWTEDDLLHASTKEVGYLIDPATLELVEGQEITEQTVTEKEKK